jgi:hypothetical protein
MGDRHSTCSVAIDIQVSGAARKIAPHRRGRRLGANALRFMADDLKAFHGEAAQAGSAAPSSRQVDRWFWQQTVAGALLIALRAACLESPQGALRAVASRFLLPRTCLPAWM